MSKKNKNAGNLTVRTLSILNVRSGQAHPDSWYHPSHLLQEGTSSGALVLASEKPPVKGDDGTLRFDGPVVIARTLGGSAAVVPEKALPSVRAYLQGLVADPAANEPLTVEGEMQRLAEAQADAAIAQFPHWTPKFAASQRALFLENVDIAENRALAERAVKLSEDGRNRLTSFGIANRER